MQSDQFCFCLLPEIYKIHIIKLFSGLDSDLSELNIFNKFS